MPIEAVSAPAKVFDIDAARKAGASEDDILAHLRSTNPNDYKYDEALKSGASKSQINDYVAGKINDPKGNWDVFKASITKTKDGILDYVRPVADSLGVATGAGLTSGTGPGAFIGGAVGGVATDALMQKLYSTKRQAENRTTLADVTKTDKGSLGETVANATQYAGLNELLGSLGNKAISKLKALGAPLSELEKLGPTFSQAGPKSNARMLSSIIENIWNPSGKAKALQKSSEAAKGMFQNILEDPNVAGAQNLTTTDRMSIGSLNRRFAQNSEKINNIGKNITVPVETPTLPSGNVNPFPAAGSEVHSPIYLKNTVDQAKQFLIENANNKETDPRLIKQAQTFLEHTENGKNPISFQDANDLLHGPDGATGLEQQAIKNPGEYSRFKDEQARFADAMNNDIQQSLQKWGDPKALTAYNDARAASLIKSAITKGGKVQDLVGNSLDSIPSLDATLKNAELTQKLLNRSSVEGLPSTNMRQDLAGYRLNQMWKAADNGSGLIDGKKLLQAWNDPSFQDTKNLLYGSESSGTQARITELFNNIAKVSDTGTGNWGVVRNSLHGLMLGGNIVRGLISGSAATAAGSLIGLELPPYVLAKIMTKPAAARIMQRLVTGAPLDATEQQAGRLIMSGLNGVTVNLVNSDGKRTEAKVQGGEIK